MPATKKATKTATKTGVKKAGEKRLGFYANIKAKQERIAHGSGERMRKPGDKGAPSSDEFEKPQKTSRSNKSSLNASAKVARKLPSKKATSRSPPAKRPAR